METIEQHFGVNAFSAPNLHDTTKCAGSSSQADGNSNSSTPNTHWYF